jgi:hypothetical protein
MLPPSSGYLRQEEQPVSQAGVPELEHSYIALMTCEPMITLMPREVINNHLNANVEQSCS